MDVHAYARNIRMSPRKVRLVVDLVRGLSVADADAQLGFFRKAAALPVRKLLQSATANATHNFQLDAGALRIKEIRVDGGPVLKRARPRAMGRSAPIRKRTSHISIVLSDGRASGEKTVVTEAPVAENGTEKKVTTEKKVATKRTSVAKKPAVSKAKKVERAD
jgi:large subunit ribosomal protein L22